MKKTLAITAFVVATLSAIAGGCTFLGNIIMDEKSCPRYVKLADFTNDTTSARVVWPEADSWCCNLILAIPISSPTNCPLARNCPQYSGTVKVRDASRHDIGYFDINPSNSGHCNWLSDHSLDAFVVGWQETNCLKTAMVAGKEYEITVNIPSRPKEFTSLWLGFVQSGRQMRKDRQKNPQTKQTRDAVEAQTRPATGQNK